MRIYLDHAATTPVLPAVADYMHTILTGDYANPSSVHSTGRKARSVVEKARRQVARLIGADPEEIVFTSGGTEANNLALQGVARAAGSRAHFITTGIEHPAVLDVCRAIAGDGHEVTVLDVDAMGRVDPDAVRAAIRPNTVLISVMLANNEVGTIQPVAEIARIARERDILMHTDAVQAVGHIPVNVRELNVDFLSFSSHKIYGPKGVGALFVRRGIRKRMRPLLYGGGQEGRLRPGTENVPGIAGFGLAAEIAAGDLDDRRVRESAWRDRLIQGLLEQIPGSRLNGHPVERLPNNVNISFTGVDIEALLVQLDLEGIAASSGAACAAGSVEPSYVLMALGLDRKLASQALRLTVGRANDDEQIETALQVIPRVVTAQRAAAQRLVQDTRL